MKYFTHNSDASKATRLRKFTRRFGAAGYGLWWMLVEAAATDMESCGGWLHPEFDWEDLALNAGFEAAGDLDPMLSMLESLRDEDGLGLIVRGADGRVGIPSLLNHLSEHLAKKQKRTTGDWTPFSGETVRNSGVFVGFSGGTPEFVGSSPVLKEKKGEEKKGDENSVQPQAVARVPVDCVPFPEFWAIWLHNRKGKADALKAWTVLKPDRALFDRIKMDLSDRMTRDPTWAKGMVMLPATYIRGRRWEDELGLPSQMNGATAPARRLRVWEIPIPEEQLWAVEGRREMGQVYRDGLWVRFEDLDPEDPDYRAPEVSNG